MAFHVACPITCRRICFCDLGFPRRLQNDKGKNDFLEEVLRIEEFIKDPWLLKADANATVQVKVPKVAVVAPPPLQPPPTIQFPAPGTVRDGVGGGDVDEAALAVSAQTKRVALQKKAAAASLVAEDYARRFESGEVAEQVTAKDDAGEEQGVSNVKVMCRLCFGGENEGSERAKKMLPCNNCGKKYHRGCLKSWAQHRDLFHWSSWTCPSCRICEVCRRTGDPNKFMFCKRCDGAYHCYCQHPPHKNVGSGPYLCPKHTRCHSCASTVPGNGLSVRWFLGYTCCDACGRLFVKGNYCPVCLKVYRDSEATPMVCCDVCQRWVHCQCDGISDAKYLQFQVDGNLQYVCPTCRGECYQVRNLEEAVQELWRRRDEADKDLVASLRAAAGLPSQEEIFSISPFSDDEDNGPGVSRNEYGRSLKFSLKGLVDKSPKTTKEYGKKSSNKKYGKKKGNQLSVVSVAEARESYDGQDDASSFGYASADNRNEQIQPSGSGEPDNLLSPGTGNLVDGISSVNRSGVLKHRFIDEVTASNGNRAPRTVKIKNKRLQGGLNTGEDTGNEISASKTSKGPKLVIHLGTRSKKMASSPKSDASSYQKEQDLTTSNGSEEDASGSGLKDSMDKQDTAAKFSHRKATVDQIKGSKLRGKEDSLIKIRKAGTEVTDMFSKFSGAKLSDMADSVNTVSMRSSLGKRSAEGSTAALRMNTDLPVSKANKSSMINDDNDFSPSLLLSQKEPKLLKLKFKNPITDNHSSWAPKEDEKSSVKGQRSKRKRPSPLREKALNKDGDDNDAQQLYEDSSMDEIMDANWILQKLGKDAIGKRVEVHQPSDNSWNKGTVREVFEGSIVSVALDNGMSRSLELGKQGIRFISQKRKKC